MRTPAPLGIAALLAGLALASLAPAQERSQEELQRRYQEKLALEFVETGGWITDFDEARARAKKEGKVLFVYFSRSYEP